MLELIFQIAAVCSAFLAAWLWYQSTKVPVPPSMGFAMIAHNDGLDYDNPEKRWARDISEKNRRAALATAFSVGGQGLAVLAGMLNWP